MAIGTLRNRPTLHSSMLKTSGMLLCSVGLRIQRTASDFIAGFRFSMKRLLQFQSHPVPYTHIGETSRLLLFIRHD